MHPYPDLKPADIAGVRSRSISGKLSKNLIVPHTDLYHFLIIGVCLPWVDDYVIFESISKGIAVGRLSFYDPEDVVIFRRALPHCNPANEQLVRREAAAALTLKGRARYDWLLLVQLALTLPSLMLRGKFPPYRPEDLPYGRNKAYICTEAVVFAWAHVGWPIVPRGIVPVPAAIKQANLDGTLEQVYPQLKEDA